MSKVQHTPALCKMHEVRYSTSSGGPKVMHVETDPELRECGSKLTTPVSRVGSEMRRQ